MGLSFDRPPPPETHAEEPLRPSPILEYWPLMNINHCPGVAKVSIGVAHRNYNRNNKFDGHPADVIYGSTEVMGIKKENYWTFDLHDLRFREEAAGAVWLLFAEVFVDGVSIQKFEFPGIAVEPRPTRLSTPEIFTLELEDKSKPAGMTRDPPRFPSISDYHTAI